MAILVMATFAFIPARAATSQSLPAYCGTVGAQGYQQPQDLQPPYVPLNRGTLITVTTASDENPGPDGTISLREAITATNNSPGVYTIDFSPSLANATITIHTALPALAGGNVIINGDVDGDGKSDVTIQGGVWPAALSIDSSGNTLYGLKIRGNSTSGVLLNPASTAKSTYSNNNIDGLFIQGAMNSGIDLQTAHGQTGESWINTAIINNIINVSSNPSGDGIDVRTGFSSGAYVGGTTIMGNTIATASSLAGHATGITVQAGFGSGSNGNEVLDTLIAKNVVDSGGYSNNAGILAYVGGTDASNNVFEGLRIIDNRITQSSPGNGSEAINIGQAEDSPPGGPYPINNTFEDAWVMGNIIQGPGAFGIDAAKASQVNSIERNIFIVGNMINLTYTTPGFSTVGVRLVSGSIPDSGIKNNLLSDAVVMWNTIVLGHPEIGINDEGILIIGGQFGSTLNQLNSSVISNNLIQPGGDIGINIFGGFQGANNNTVSSLQVTCNLITSSPASTLGYNQAFKGITVTGGFSASGNTVKDLLISGNLVAGTLDDVTVNADLGQGSTGNTVAYASAALTVTSTLTTTSISSATSTSTTTILSTTTSTATSTVTSTLPPVTTTITGPASTTTVTTGGGGIPEFPYQILTVTVFTVLVIASYLVFRRRTSHDRL